MNRFQPFLIAFSLAAFAGCNAKAQTPPAPAQLNSAPPVVLPGARAQHVFIFSFDGGKPPVMLQSRMPRFFSLALGGAWTPVARTIVPSITLPSHTSMLTGVVMEKHKITWNDYRAAQGTVKVPTAFGLAKEKGLKTALFAGKEKFKHLDVPGTLDKFLIPSYKSDVVGREAAAYIEAEKPNLCFIHFADPDGAGHAHGWGSPEQIKAFEDADAALDVVMNAIDRAGIRSQSVVILSADHGGHDKTHGSTQDADMQIPWVASGRGVKTSVRLQNPINTTDTAVTALWLLGVPVPDGLDGKVVSEAFETQAGGK